MEASFIGGGGWTAVAKAVAAKGASGPPKGRVRAAAQRPVVAIAENALPPPREPLWLVRIVMVLFLVGFAAFLAREVRGLLDAVGVTRSLLYWSGLGLGLAIGVAVGAVAGLLAMRGRRRS